MTENTKGAMSLMGVGAAACAACCAVPIIGVIAAAGLATALAYAAVGAIALAIAVPGLIWAIRKKRTQASCAVDAGPQPVEISKVTSAPEP